MKLSALIVAALFVGSVAQATTTTTAPAAKTAKGTTTTTTTTTTTGAAATTGTTATGTTTAAVDHKDCSTLTGKEKKTCEAHEKTAHKAGDTHTH